MDRDSQNVQAGATESARTNQMAQIFGGRTVLPQMAAVLDMLESLHGKPIEQLDADEARRQPTPANAVTRLLEERDANTGHEDVGDVGDRTIAGPAGDIPIRVYIPASAREGGPMPVVFYIHGGGWVLADLEVYDASARALCNAAHAIVVSTHYRQGPEDRFPAAHDDTFAAYKWTFENAAELGGDPLRIAIVGESAGGNMAADICIRARAEGVQAPLHQVLIYPVADYSMSSESYGEMTQAKPLNSAMMGWFFKNYLRSPEDGNLPQISLVNAKLAGVAPATIICAELDPLRSEGERLADKLKDAGVPVRQRTYAGVTHEFFGMRAVLDPARDAVHFAAEGLMRAFGTLPER